jgi:hypothetical protein
MPPLGTRDKEKLNPFLPVLVLVLVLVVGVR